MPKLNRAGNITGLRRGEVKMFMRQALGGSGDKTLFTVKRNNGRLKPGLDSYNKCNSFS